MILAASIKTDNGDAHVPVGAGDPRLDGTLGGPRPGFDRRQGQEGIAEKTAAGDFLHTRYFTSSTN
jgi:hypothetical protein